MVLVPIAAIAKSPNQTHSVPVLPTAPTELFCHYQPNPAALPGDNYLIQPTALK